MRIAGLRPTSLFDGKGINYVIFTQGCQHHCKGCQNPSTWNFNGGNEIPVDVIMKQIKSYIGFVDGVTFSGGDPAYQMWQVKEIARWAKQNGLHTTMYTGFSFLSFDKDDLQDIDCLIDGEYVEKYHGADIPFRGSSNQHIWKKDKDNHWYMEE